MGIPLNFGEEATDADDFKPVEDGEYVVRCEDVEVEQGKNAPYLNMKFSIGPEFKKLVWDMWSLSDKKFPRKQLQENLETLTGEEWKDEEMDLEPKELVGLVCNAIITTDTYFSEKKNKDVTKNIIAEYLPADDSDYGNDPFPVFAGSSDEEPF